MRTELGAPSSNPAKYRFPGVSLSVTHPTKTCGKLFSALLLKRKQWEKSNPDFWGLPMYNITAAVSLW